MPFIYEVALIFMACISVELGKNRTELERYIKVERITRLSVFTANATHLFISA